MLGRLLLLVILVVQIPFSLGTGTLELKLVSYENPTYKVSDGTCCESNETSACSPHECDPWIDICIDHLTSYRQSLCLGGLSKTNVHENSDSFVFGANEGKTLNPMHFSFSNWKGGFKLNLTVQDDDHVDDANSSYGKADMMEVLVYNLTSLSGANGHPTQNRTRITLGTLVKLVIEVRAYCDKNYYGSCNTQCVPRPGKYFCDSNGNTIYANAPTKSITATKRPPTNSAGHHSTIKSALLPSSTFWQSSAKAPVSGLLHLQSTTPVPSTKQTRSSYSTSRYQQTSTKLLSKAPATVSRSAKPPAHHRSTYSSIQSSNASTTSSSSSNSRSNFIDDSLGFIGVVTGIIIGAIVALLLIVLLIVFCCREHSKTRRESKIIHGNRVSSAAPKSSVIDAW